MSDRVQATLLLEMHGQRVSSATFWRTNRTSDRSVDGGTRARSDACSYSRNRSAAVAAAWGEPARTCVGIASPGSRHEARGIR